VRWQTMAVTFVIGNAATACRVSILQPGTTSTRLARPHEFTEAVGDLTLSS